MSAFKLFAKQSRSFRSNCRHLLKWVKKTSRISSYDLRQSFYLRPMNFSRKNIANPVRFAIILLISATISVSCTKEIDGDLPSVETQLVVDANIETNTPPIFILTKTSPVFGGFDLD